MRFDGPVVIQNLTQGGCAGSKALRNVELLCIDLWNLAETGHFVLATIPPGPGSPGG
jgi:hypothetical protein